MKLKYLTIFFIAFLSLFLSACNTPVEPWGVHITIDGVNLNNWTNAVPENRHNPDLGTARYIVTVTQSDDLVETCEYALFGIGATTFTIYRKRKMAEVTLTDLTTQVILATEIFGGSSPPQCPDTVSSTEPGNRRDDYGGVPSLSRFETWLSEILLQVEEGTWVTLTPTPTLIPTRTLGPRPLGTATPTASPTLSQTPRPDYTPIVKPIVDGNYLVFTGTVMVRDEYNNAIARVTEGAYPLLGIADENYVIVYQETIAYVTLSSTNAYPSLSQIVMTPTSSPTLASTLTRTPRPILTLPPTGLPTASPTPTLSQTPRPNYTPIVTASADGNYLVFTGTVMLRDEFNVSIARVTEGEYPLLGIADENYVIVYEGRIAYVALSSTNAHPSILFTPTPDN